MGKKSQKSEGGGRLTEPPSRANWRPVLLIRIQNVVGPVPFTKATASQGKRRASNDAWKLDCLKQSSSEAVQQIRSSLEIAVN